MKRKGISLIVLIITIVVVILLATAIIANLAQTNLISNANAAVFKSDVANMKEELSTYLADEYIAKLGKYDSSKLQATEEGIWYGSTQLEGTITDIIPSMNEKYVGKLFIQNGKLVANKMTITTQEEEFLKDIGIETTHQTDIGKIEITPSTKDWINGNVELEISYTKEIPESYAIEYKTIGGADWQKGTRVVVEENNTTVITRLYSKEKNNEALSNSYTVSNIDKEVPDITAMQITLTSSENSIIATASGATDALSGISKYQYSLDNSTWQDSGTFSGIKSGTETTVYAKVIDKVGNESASISNKGTTSSIAGTATISQNPAATKSDGTVNWTKGNVSVTLSYSNVPTGYVIQYSLSGGTTKDWTSYSSAISITANNTTVKARLYNSSVDDEVASSSKTISNIDKEDPDITAMQITLTSSENLITATASGATDALSGISKYQYSLDNTTWQDSGTFSGIKSGTETTVYAKAIDKVGNESVSTSNKGTTIEITAPKITLEPSEEWTSGNVIAKVEATIPEGYELQYKLSGAVTKGWTEYIGEVTLDTNNTTIVARLYNENVDDEIASLSKTASNIDKENPTEPTILTLNENGNSITATADGSIDRLSGMLKYQYSKDGTIWQDSDIFNDLIYGTNYIIYARAVDKTGNVSTTKTNTITLNKLEGSITLSETNGIVTLGKTKSFIITKNISGGKLSVTSSNNDVATVTISGTTVTITGKTTGVVDITVTSEETSTYKTASVTYSATIEINAESVKIEPSTYYGKNVMNYKPGNNSSVGWKIFHSDGTNIYLISEDYIDVSELPYSTNSSGITTTNKPVNTNSSTSKGASFTNIVDDYEGSSRIGTPLKSLNYNYFNVNGYMSSEYNMKSVAYMLDTDAWSVFSNGTVEYVIGGPTVELLFKSYNNRYDTEYESQANSNIGYQIRKTSSDSWLNIIANMFVSDELYFLRMSTGAQGYWVSSPSMNGAKYVMQVGKNGTFGYGATYTNSTNGFRPVVCLKDNIKLQASGDGYIISGNIGKVEITQSATNWTNEEIAVTLSHAEVNGYTLQYKLVDGTGKIIQDWTTYSTAIKINEKTGNNITVQARMYNEVLNDEGYSANSKTISNGDYDRPTVPNNVNIITGTSRLTVTVSGSTDETSGVSKYQYSKDCVTWQDSGIFTNLTYGSSYTIYSRSVDNAGNVSSSKVNKVILEHIQVDENVIVTEKNATINGNKPTYNNPVIPVGFKAVNTTDATWSDVDRDGKPDGWNDGLVIADVNGNEFVWVPVDGTNVIYSKHSELAYTCVDDSDALPTVNNILIDGETQISEYCGFYIGRYEAGVPANQTTIDGTIADTSNVVETPVVKQGVKAWTNISYKNAILSALAFCNTKNLKSGLVTGIQWDTVCTWIYSEKDINGNIIYGDSRKWGNYSDSKSPANVTGYGSKQTTGYSEYWRAKNIFDMAGNTYEWVGELASYNVTSNSPIYRGGYFNDSGSQYSVLDRDCYSKSKFEYYDYVSFRIVLYIM